MLSGIGKHQLSLPHACPESTVCIGLSPSLVTDYTHQPQFSSTPALPMDGGPAVTAGYVGGLGGGGGVEEGNRRVLGSLASQENTKQQVRYSTESVNVMSFTVKLVG